MSETMLAMNSTRSFDEIEIIWSGRVWLNEHAAMRAQLWPAVASTYGNDTDDIVICVGCPSNCLSLAVAPTKEAPARQKE